MNYLILVLVWLSGVTCGIVAAIVMREHFLRRPSSLPEIDAHERDTWPVGRG